MSSENKSKNSSQQQSERQKNLPIVSSEDVEFSSEAADSEDLEAQARAAKANNQQNNSNK
jgi:hypothetical protein